MRIYFIGVGGAGIGPLALIAMKAGYEVLGSEIKANSYTKYLSGKGIQISYKQDGENISRAHEESPIDLVIGVSAIIRDNIDHPELKFARKKNIKIAERDELLNKILQDYDLKLISIAGTHGKTTTTAMVVWIMKQIGIPISYSVGAKLPFGEMSDFALDSKYFIYECDEFHKNFLHFYPHTAAITGVSWDHHEIFRTEEEYDASFRQFLNQSERVVIYQDDIKKVKWHKSEQTKLLDKKDSAIDEIKLAGRYFREDAWLAVNTVRNYTDLSIEKLVGIVSNYPGSSRRMERLAKDLYTDYAHTPEKITGCLDTAREMLEHDQKLVIVYEPLTNRRQHYIFDSYKNLFVGVDQLYWVPSYQAREDKSLEVIEPKDFIKTLSNHNLASPAQLNSELWDKIQYHLSNGDFVVLISGGGGGSLDEWARDKLNS